MGGPTATSLQLKSEDGVMFRVEKYYLQSHSGMFRDMLALPTPEPTSSPLPSSISSTSSSLPFSTSMPVIVDIPAHSTVLQYAIKVMELEDLPPPREAADQLPDRGAAGKLIDFYISLVRLLDFLDCAAPTRLRGLAQFESVFDASMPWCTFAIGARSGNLAVAKRGIRRIGLLPWSEQRHFFPEIMTLDDGEAIPLPWLMGYYSAYSKAVCSGHDPEVVATSLEAACWVKISENLLGPVGLRA